MYGYAMFLGALLGAAGTYWWITTQQDLQKVTREAEKREDKEEIKRLREQVARLIGVEKPTPCDVVHMRQNARGVEQAERLPKAA